MQPAATDVFNLIPDWTLGVQALIFLAVVLSMSSMVFKPIRRIIQRRREFTEEARREAVSVEDEAEQLTQGREEVLSIALLEAQAERAKRLAGAHSEADAVVAQARTGARVLLDSAAESAAKEAAQDETGMRRSAGEMADSIVERVTGS